MNAMFLSVGLLRTSYQNRNSDRQHFFKHTRSTVTAAIPLWPTWRCQTAKCKYHSDKCTSGSCSASCYPSQVNSLPLLHTLRHTNANPHTFTSRKPRQHNPHARLALPALPAPVPPRRIRQKKGPRRIKKQVAKSREQLDKEMEDYRAAADTFGL